MALGPFKSVLHLYRQWNPMFFMEVHAKSLFYRLIIGYFLAYLSFLPSIHMFRQRRRKHGSESVSPEARLWWLLYGESRLPITKAICLFSQKCMMVSHTLPA